VNNLRLPAERASGRLELLPEGYDAESMIYTMTGGPEIEDPGANDSKKFLDVNFEEFCFLESDRERATSVAIAAMLTLFVSHTSQRERSPPASSLQETPEAPAKLSWLEGQSFPASDSPPRAASLNRRKKFKNVSLRPPSPALRFCFSITASGMYQVVPSKAH
jgi:hypothetical protein